MPISSEILALLRCPISGRALQAANPSLIDRVNGQIRAGDLLNQAGRPVSEPLDEGLIDESQKWLIPIRKGVVTLLQDDLISISDVT